MSPEERMRTERFLKQGKPIHWITEDTHLQFVHIDISHPLMLRKPPQPNILKELATMSAFKNVSHYFDTFELKENIDSFVLAYVTSNHDDKDELISMKCLGLYVDDRTMVKVPQYSVCDASLVPDCLLSNMSWPNLETLVIREFRYYSVIMRDDWITEPFTEFFKCLQSSRFPSCKVIRFLDMETDHFLTLIENLLAAAIRNEGPNLQENLTVDEAKMDKESSVWWSRIEELDIGVLQPPIDGFLDYGSSYGTEYHLKSQWDSLFISMAQLRYGDQHTKNTFSHAQTCPTVFPNIQRITFRTCLPSWKIMRVFERESPSVSVKNNSEQPLLSNSSALLVGHCFADVFNPCPCIECARVSSSSALRHGGVAITCSASDKELANYLANFLVPERLSVAFLKMTESDKDDRYENGYNASDSSDEEAEDTCFTSTCLSVYSDLLAAMERGALDSLRHLHVNESFLFLCGCLNQIHSCSNFIAVRSCISLEVLKIDLHSSNHSKLTTMLQTFLCKCLEKAFHDESLIVLHTVDFVVDTLDRLNDVSRVLCDVVQSMTAASTSDSGECREGNDRSGVALRVSLRTTMKSCKVAQMLRHY
eukprot:CAMPEP_0114451474 /NCGR_PEP_ID=MMETSP0104-20121206/1001_1 /TAXON_ID=37642 ORGANISM="Paraphysomonas imperforata, Strain PA2" /NCGR_SAMPLE_ID=MMETSP0104 /ASSEMBLY_ACC=CAM_ASM_000202 /LENGTH=592 /DNA_ID=CAMNT_0001623661 /DNA_START=268 /DNA_END=2046 /DNA_ORIENTATION=-